MTIREVEAKDLEWLLSLRNDESTRKWLGCSDKLSFEEQVRWYVGMKNDSHKNYMIIEVDSDPVGLIRKDEIDLNNASIRIGVDIHKNFRRNGYAYNAYRMLISDLFSLGYHRIWLLVDEENSPAINLYKKFGFKEEGRQRDALNRQSGFRDYIMMSLLEVEWTK